MTELAKEYSGQEASYKLNGEPVSEKEGKAAGAEWFDHEKRASFGLSSIKYDGHAPTPLVRDTNVVAAVLEACASSAARGGAPGDSAPSVAVAPGSADGKRTVTGSSYAPRTTE